MQKKLNKNSMSERKKLKKTTHKKTFSM